MPSFGNFAEMMSERSATSRMYGEINVADIVEEKQEDYDDQYVSGTLTPILEFAEERMLKYRDEDHLCELIANKYPSYVVGQDQSGELMVDVKDLWKGISIL